MYSCHLFLISTASVGSILFLSFIVPIFAWIVPLVSLIFLQWSLVFPFLFFHLFLCIDHWGKLSYLFCCSLELCIQMGISFSFSFAFHALLFSAIGKASSDNHFAFLHFFFWGWSWSLPPVQCYQPPSIVLQALCLSDLIPWIYFSLPLYNRKGFDVTCSVQFSSIQSLSSVRPFATPWTAAHQASLSITNSWS